MLWWPTGNPLLPHLERQPASAALHLHAGEIQPGLHRAHLQDLCPAGGRGRADLPAARHAGRGEQGEREGDSTRGHCSDVSPCPSSSSTAAPLTPSAPTTAVPPPPPSWDPTPSKSPSPSGRRSATAWMLPTPGATTGDFSPRSCPWTGGSPQALLSLPCAPSRQASLRAPCQPRHPVGLCPNAGWTGLGALWNNGRYPCLWQGSWN